MQRTACGRFCEQCQKPVIDFTGLRRAHVVNYLKQHPGTCGRFGPEQVDPSLIPIEDVGRGIRKGVLASLAAFAIHTAQAQQNTPTTPPATEQTVHEPSVNDAVEGTCAREPEVISTKEGGTKSWVDEKRRAEPYRDPLMRGAKDSTGPRDATTKERTRVFLSTRFPFIHVRRKQPLIVVYRMGRFL
jgi:hypothetical protein